MGFKKARRFWTKDRSWHKPLRPSGPAKRPKPESSKMEPTKAGDRQLRNPPPQKTKKKPLCDRSLFLVSPEG